VHDHEPCVRSEFDGHSEVRALSAQFGERLITALAQLPNKLKVFVSPVVDGLGLNSPLLWYSDEYAVGRIGNRVHAKSNDVAAKLAANAIVSMHVVEGVEVFLQALSGSAMKVRNMQLGGEWPKQMPFFLERYGCVEEQTLCDIAQHLTSLTVGCKDDDDLDNIFGEPSVWTAFFASTVNLRSLKIHLGTASNPSGWQMAGYLSVVHHALVRGCMPKLQALELVGQMDKPGLVHAQHLQQFLRNHTATLQNVKLSGVLFMLPDRTDGALGRTIKDLLGLDSHQ